MNRLDMVNQPNYSVKLNDDCWERVFDLLSLRDILAMSQTCRRMCESGAKYFHAHFRGISCELIGEKYTIDSFEFERNAFLQSIDKLVISGQLNDLDHFANTESYRSLSTLLLHGTDLIEDQVDAFKNILNRIECIELYECTMHEDFFERFLESCPKLRCLRIYGGSFKPASAANGLFLQNHPTLQYLHYSLGYNPPGIMPLNRFLELNRNVKCLEIDDDQLWANRNTCNRSNIQLESLVVRINSAKMTATDFAHLLKTLNERGFYRAVHLSIEWIPESFDCQEFIDEMIAVRSFETLYSQFYVSLARLTQLKELRVLGREFHEDFQTLAANLTQLERIELSATSTDHFLPFIRCSKTLQKIHVNKLMGGSHFNGTSVNVFALDCERRKLENAHQISIGLFEEQIYLDTKWAIESLHRPKPTLIEIERGDKMQFSFDVMNKYLSGEL